MSPDKPDISDAMGRYTRAISLLESAGAEEMRVLEREFEGFPEGVDPYLGNRWITNAIDVGAAESVRWILDHGVDLSFRDDCGYTPLHSALERERDDRLELLEGLLRAGAPVDLKGINDWTPAHMAAARDDVDALRLLVAYGADLSIRTEIDDRATPLEEARTLGKRNAVGYLEGIPSKG
jgi:ankyrin repeat protein